MNGAAPSADLRSSDRVVSVIAPARNERAYIEPFCASALAQRLPLGWTLELLIADGMSDDGTRDVLARLAAADPRIQWFDNPRRIVSSGLNAGIGRARGDVIVRMDVHTRFADDYVAQCLAALEASGADNVGGPWRATAEPGAHPTQHAVAAAFQSRWVSGGALSRRLDYDGAADTVYLGCWPRRTFERFGTFDEALVRNQDDEHNLRITLGSGKIWQASGIRSEYRPRAALRQVYRQYLQYGYWKPFVMRKHGQPASLRQLVPGLFVLGLCLFALAGAAGAPAWPLAALLAAYAAAVFAMTMAVRRGQVLGPSILARIPAVIVTYHLSYGVGSLIGWWDVLWHRNGRARFATLTR